MLRAGAGRERPGWKKVTNLLKSMRKSCRMFHTLHARHANVDDCFTFGTCTAQKLTNVSRKVTISVLSSGISIAMFDRWIFSPIRKSDSVAN